MPLSLESIGGGTITIEVVGDGQTIAIAAGVASSSGGGASALDGLSDVTITAPSSGEVLKYDGSGWVNGAVAGSGTVTSVSLTVPAGLAVSGSPVTGSGTLAITTALSGLIKGTGSGFAAAVAGTDYLADITGESLDDLADVTITSVASGEVLAWSGTAWINRTLAEAGIAAASHTHLLADVTDAGTAAAADTGDFEAAGAVATHAAVTSGVHGITAFGATVVAAADAAAARAILSAAASTHQHAASDITSGTLSVLRGGTGAGTLPVVSNYTGGATVNDYLSGIDTEFGNKADAADVAAIVFEFARLFVDGAGAAIGTGTPRTKLAGRAGTINKAHILLDASDSGTLTITIKNSGGTTTSAGTVSVSSSDRASNADITWTSGTLQDGTVAIGDTITIEPTSGFGVATVLSASLTGVA